MAGAIKSTTLPNGIDAPPVDGWRSELKTANFSVLATVADCGKAYLCTNTITATLPATAIGCVYTFVNSNPNGVAITVAPAAADGIAFAGVAVVINKGVINTAATARKGDFITIASLNGATGVTAWCVVAQRGIWAKQP